MSWGAYNVRKCKNPEIFGFIQILAPVNHFSSSSILLLNRIFAYLLGFDENEEVIVQKVEGVATCSSFQVELSSAEDWDIVKNSCHRIEEFLLEQLQLITVGQKYPIWVAQNLLIYFTVVQIDARPFLKQSGRLSECTEVHVKSHYQQFEDLAKMGSSEDNGLELLPTLLTRRMQNLYSDFTTLSFRSRIKEYCGDVNTKITTRVLPEILYIDAFVEQLDILAVFKLNYGRKVAETVTLSNVLNCATGEKVYAILIELPRRCSRFTALIDCLKRYDPRYCAFSSALCQSMNGEYSWMKISPLPSNSICQIEVLEVLSEGNLPGDFDEILRKHLWKTCQHYPIIVPAGGLKLEVHLMSGVCVQCLIRLPHAEDADMADFSSKCFVFTNDTFPVLVYFDSNMMKDDVCKSGANISRRSINGKAINFGGLKCEITDFTFQNAFVDKCYRYIMYHLMKTAFSPSENILITGDKSSGKTTVIQILARKLLHSHLAVYSECHQCIAWNDGKSPEKFEESLKTAILRLKQRQPSVLFLDDLDFFPRKQDEDVRDIRLERYFDLLKNSASANELLIIATACTKREIIELFSLNLSGRFFGYMECIQKHSLADREECLEKFCNLEADICSLRSAAKSTQKCTTGDLKRLARRIVLEAKAKGHAKIEEEDVQQALAGFLPTALSIEHPMPLDMANLKWEDVGGLHNVKQILTEVFIWPTKYPLLYRNNSLRLGRGVLLYGPSGCGKTLISKILATQCGFNVILIKGPELLSKYIGESEENVRKTFERARTTSPCLIFFDEFDSIGPKRGDGDTGVTDRIVNQLLTELDGVEALEGVYVLAATNRIDLIDGALLRPGRFDYVIKCELPGKEDRKSILDILCRSLNLADDVDLEAIAAATDGWTGADLKGLIVNAQVNAYRRSENAFTEKGMNLDLEKCSRSYAISQEDLFFSMDESQSKIKRSSVTNRERHISRMLTTLA